MNLYLFNENDSAATYGIGSYLKELTHALDSSGFHIHILHLHSSHPEFQILKTNQVENWHIPEIRNSKLFPSSVQKTDDYNRNVIYLLRLYIKDTSDLIFHFNYNHCHLFAQELKSIFDCKIVSTVHYTKWSLELQGNLSLLHTLKKKSENQRSSFEQILLSTDEFESLLYKNVDRIIALSQDMKNFLCSEYQLDSNKISVIPNGITDISSEIETGKDVLRKKWRLFDREHVIIFAGRLHPVKGLVFLISSFRKLLEIFPDCRLIIAGNGNYDIYLQEAKDICMKINFTGLLGKKELIMLDDGSTDKSQDIIKTFDDKRIRYIFCRHDFIATLNKGQKLALGKYIAQLDHDDIMMPDRLKIQYDYMETHTEVAACGGYMEFFGKRTGIWRLPLEPEKLLPFTIIHTPILNPTGFVRRDIIERYKIRHRRGYSFAQDYKFWTDIIKIGKLANIPEILVRYRSSDSQAGIKYRKESTVASYKIQSEMVNFFLSHVNKDEMISKKLLSQWMPVFRQIAESGYLSTPLFYNLLHELISGLINDKIIII